MLCYVVFSCEWGNMWNIWNLFIYLGTADANDSFTGHTVCIMFGTDCATVWYSERKVEREKKQRNTMTSSAGHGSSSWPIT